VTAAGTLREGLRGAAVTVLPVRGPTLRVASPAGPLPPEGARGPPGWRATCGAAPAGAATRGVGGCGAFKRGAGPTRGAATRGTGAMCGAGACGTGAATCGTGIRGGGAMWGAGADMRGAEKAGGAMCGAGAEICGAGGGAEMRGAGGGAEMWGTGAPPPGRFSCAAPDTTRDGKKVTETARTQRPVARISQTPTWPPTDNAQRRRLFRGATTAVRN
jgi:hypothetical protein